MTIPNNYAQVNFRYGGSQYPSGAEWTLGLGIASFPGTPGDLGDIATTAWHDNLRAVTTADATLVDVLVKFGPDATGAAAVVALGEAGTLVEAGISPNVAILFRRNTAFGGRHGRGRLYLPGGTEPRVSQGGDLSGASVAFYNLAMDGLMDDFRANDCVPVLLHSDNTVPYPITSFACQTKVATQRRRLRR